MSRTGENLVTEWNLGYKRGRASRACKECKTNRRKCDGMDPCKSCIEIGTPQLCVYEVPKKRGRRFRGETSGEMKEPDPGNVSLIPSEVPDDQQSLPTSEEGPAHVPKFKLSATVPSFSFVPVIVPTTSLENPIITSNINNPINISSPINISNTSNVEGNVTMRIDILKSKEFEDEDEETKYPETDTSHSDFIMRSSSSVGEETDQPQLAQSFPPQTQPLPSTIPTFPQPISVPPQTQSLPQKKPPPQTDEELEEEKVSLEYPHLGEVLSLFQKKPKKD